MSTTLQSLTLELYFINERINVDKSLTMPCLTSLTLFNHDAAALALLKSCSESLVYLKVTSQDSSWVNHVRCNLPSLRRAVIKPFPANEDLEYFKKRCCSTAVIKTN